MIRLLTGTWRSFGPLVINLLDNVYVTPPPGGFAAYTTGRTILDPARPSGGSPTNDRMMIVGFTVSAKALLPQQSNDSAYGRFGKVLAGITTDSTQTADANLAGINALPADLSLVAELWNPDSDPLPPVQVGNSTNNLQLSATTTLPQPVRIPRGGTGILVGMWAWPSILASVSSGGLTPVLPLAITNATWELSYDDGQ